MKITTPTTTTHTPKSITTTTTTTTAHIAKTITMMTLTAKSSIAPTTQTANMKASMSGSQFRGTPSTRRSKALCCNVRVLVGGQEGFNFQH